MKRARDARVTVAPSIIAADFGDLGGAARRAERAGADWLHVDVMDGHFVPNITLGSAAVAALKGACALPLDVHLMIEDPDRYLEVFREAGSAILTVHAEACRHLNRTLRTIRGMGLKAGVAVNPSTPVRDLAYVLDVTDVINVMTVNPGFAGQSFLPEMLPKIREARELADRAPGGRVAVEVDGGITAETGRQAVEAGARVLVAGASVFRAKDMGRAIGALKSLKNSKEV